MANIKYIVELSLEERERLQSMISKGSLKATWNTKARILLHADKGEHGPCWTDRKICQALSTSTSTIARTRQTFVMEGLEAVFARAPRLHHSIKPIFDGEGEAKLIALACSEPPQGYARWTIRLLAEKVVELNIVDV